MPLETYRAHCTDLLGLTLLLVVSGACAEHPVADGGDAQSMPTAAGAAGQGARVGAGSQAPVSGGAAGNIASGVSPAAGGGGGRAPVATDRGQAGSGAAGSAGATNAGQGGSGAAGSAGAANAGQGGSNPADNAGSPAQSTNANAGASAPSTPNRGGRAILAAYNNFCALAQDGTASSWSTNGVLSIAGEAGALRFRQITLGGHIGDRLCAITQQGEGRCFFNFTEDPFAQGQLPSAALRFVRIAQRKYRDMCGILDSGEIACFGEVDWKPLVGRFTEISGGKDGTQYCAVRDDAEIVCWPEYDSPLRKPPPGPFVDVAADDDSACGLRPDGTAHCWQPIGKADYVLPGSWLQVDVDSFFSNATVCGVRRDGSIECYGIQTNGTLSPAKIDQQTDPQRLPPAGAYLELAITSSTGCAIRRDGTIACWSTTGGAVPIPPSDFIARH